MSVNTLKLTEGFLAARQNIKDIAGFFSTEVEILPGTCAVAFENGRSLGELAPGKYTLETFSDKLMFWTRKNIAIVLLRENNFSATYHSDQFYTQEGLLVEGEFQIHFSLENSGLFLKNLMGARENYTLEDFTKDTYHLVMASLQESISRFSIRDLGLPETRKYMETAMENTIRESLSRYGIRFTQLWISSLKQEAYDALKERKSELWIVRENQTLQLEEQDARLKDRQTEISLAEKENDLDILAQHVQVDRKEGELAVIKRRFDLKREMRRQIQSNDFDKIANQAEMEQFLFENDKAKLLREQEREELVAAIESQQADRTLRREAVLKKLNLQLEQDMADFQRAYNHKVKLEALDQESEIARRVETEENRKWLENLERERCERKEAFQRLTDQKEIDRVVAEIEQEKVRSENRLTELRRERELADAQQSLEIQKQRDEWERELRGRKFTDQLERLKAMQMLNQAQDRAEMDILERKRRLESELKIAEESSRQKFELEKLRVYTSFGEKGILALLGPEQANAFAASCQNDKEAAEYKARLEEREKEDSKTQALLREFLAAQERNADRLVQMHTQTPVPPAQPICPGVPTWQPGVPVTGSSRVLLCPQCRAEISENNKFCSNCGKSL
ncbi:MAG: zinc-ribbon domain-containing protein [Planctomycetia bacterium]|nr:zinc-ribbon domain-containing protein [Planctomycetia bacterium]